MRDERLLLMGVALLLAFLLLFCTARDAHALPSDAERGYQSAALSFGFNSDASMVEVQASACTRSTWPPIHRHPGPRAWRCPLVVRYGRTRCDGSLHVTARGTTTYPQLRRCRS